MVTIRQGVNLRAGVGSVAITPGAPANFTATLVGDSGVSLAWTDGGNDAAILGYRV